MDKRPTRRKKALKRPARPRAVVKAIRDARRLSGPKGDTHPGVKPEEILVPGGDIGTMELAEIIDARVIQSMMDDFHALAGFPVAVVDLNGKILVASGWQDICTKFHRVHPETCRNCVESDTLLTRDVKPGTFRVYKCRNNLWDISTPIMAEGKHLGNLFMGQLFFEDEPPDKRVFRAQARRYGFDENAYLAALGRVPRGSREKVTTAMTFCLKLANLISALSYGAIRLSRALTEHEKLLDSLRESEGHMRAVLESTDDGILAVDRGGRVMWMNTRFAELWRIPEGLRQAGEDRRLLAYVLDQLAEPDVFMERVAQLYASDDTSLDELLFKDGRVFTRYSCPLRRDQAVVGRLWSFRDITARTRAEAERLKLEQQFQQTQKLESLGVLAGGIAHDFNNILMAMMGHAELALMEISPMSAARNDITEIITASRRAAELCRQMLAYSGKASLSRERVDLGELIEEMAHLLKTSISKKALMKLNLARGLPPILADPSQLRQVVMNLIINASEAIGDATGVIGVSVGAARCDGAYLNQTELRDDLAPGLYVSLEVTDTGCGMDAETQARIFDPFFTTKFAGRGLGMAAVLGIVRAHKGALKVYSEPCRGTTVKFLFPAMEAGGEEHAPDEAKSAGDWRGSGTVLLADDEETLRALGAQMMEMMGFTVLTAANGVEAVDIYRERGKEIGIVLLDLTMPRMDGMQALDELRRINPSVRVVLASGYSCEELAARFADRGLAGVLQKPYTLGKLRELLAGLLPGREG